MFRTASSSEIATLQIIHIQGKTLGDRQGRYRRPSGKDIAPSQPA